MKYLLALSLLFIYGLKPGAQVDTELFFQRNTDVKTRQLLRKYLSTTDSAELKIKDLLEQIQVDENNNDYEAKINKLRIALVLEDYAPQNTSTTFALNRTMGFTVARLNVPYAQFLLKKAIQISYALKENSDSRQELFGSVAGLAFKAGEPDSALYFYRRSAMETRERGNRTGYASALNNIGVYYSQTTNYDSAMVYYNMSLNALEGIEADPILFCSIHDNMAQERERQGDHQYALRVYQFNDKIFTRYKRINRIVLNKMKLLNARRKTGHDQIDHQIDSLERFINDHQKELTYNTESVLSFYQFAKTYFYETRQAGKAQVYDNLFTGLKDRMDQSNRQKMDLIVNTYLNIEAAGFKKGLDWYRTKAETDRLKLEAVNQRLQYNRWIVGILALTGSIIFTLMTLYLRKSRQELNTTKRLTVAELRAKEMEAKAMQQELELKKKDLTNVVLQNTQLFDHDQKIIGRLMDIARQKEHIGKSLHSLIAEMNTKNQTRDRALVNQNNIEQINAAFYEKLETQFPPLTKSEIELCGYLRINLTNKDIALLKNVEYASVKVSKTRLRKKLGIAPEEDLCRFLQSM
jgi:hypothetical protein